MNEVTLNHEKIHLAQQKELWLVGFYILYALYWLKSRLFWNLSSYEAYHAIPFEKEAYAHESDEEYLNNRERFAWRKYL